MKLLICGVPGSGKTTFGNFLDAARSFDHYDFEIEKDYKEFNDNYISNENVIITWGFVPSFESYKIVKILTEDGYTPIWLDDGGSRERSYRKYINRKSDNSAWKKNFLYFRQILKIDNTKCADPESPIKWTYINPFKNSRSFKDGGTLFEEIKKAISAGK